MKTKHLFWGFLFITLGTLILINNFTSVDFYWLNIWEFWPLFLILLGISMLVKQEIVRGILIAITAIILGAAIFSTFISGWGFFRDEIIHGNHRIDFSDEDDNDNFETKDFEESYSENIKYATLHFQAGAGSFKITDTTGSLFSATTKGYDNYFLVRSDNGEIVNLNFKSDKERFFIFRGKNRNRANIRLNTNPVWKMDFDIGAAESEFDFRNFKVEDLNIDIGAAKLGIILGNILDSTKVDIDAGATSIVISIPENVGCQVHSKIVLSKKDFEGFNKEENGLYKTDNFESSLKKIYMNIDSGISKIKIKRYSGENW